MNKELKDALELLEKEKNVDKHSMLDAIRISLENAYRNYLIRQANAKGDKMFASVIQRDTEYISVVIDEDSYDYEIFLAKDVIPDDLEVISPLTEIKLSEAREIDEGCNVEDRVYVEAPHVDLGHIAIQNSKGLIIQKLREQEKSSLYNEFKNKEHTVVTGTIGRRLKNAFNINLGRADGILLDTDRVKDEKLQFNQRVKVYIEEVVNSSRGPKIKVSRSSPELVRKLFENEVSEIKNGVVEIKSIAREPGSRTKMSVMSTDKNVDAVGSCLGVNSSRVNSVVDELHGEKIDIVNYDEDISNYVENALSPAKSTIIVADEDAMSALVVVPDSQLSLAIGKEGQNARLAAKLTGYRIDIKSETQAVTQGIYDKLGIDYDHSKYADVEKQTNGDTEESKQQDVDVNKEENAENIEIEHEADVNNEE